MKLDDYQEDAVRFLRQRKRAILADDVGLGKTVEAIAASSLPCLIVCKKNPRWQWMEFVLGASEYAPQLTGAKVGIIDGSGNARLKQLQESAAWDVVIVNYEFLQSTTKNKVKMFRYPEVFTRKWGTVIIDEAHKLRNHKATWTTNALRLKTDYLYLLTADPIVDNGGDLFALLRLCNPLRFGSYWQFLENFHVTDQKYKQVIGAARNPEMFGRMVSNYMLQRTYEDVGLPRPERVVERLPVKLAPETRKRIRRAFKEYWAEFDGVQVPLSSAGATVHAVRRMVAEDPNKLDTLVDLVADRTDDNPIIWCWYRSSAHRVAETLSSRERDVFLITGEMSDKERRNAVDEYKRRGGFLVATLATMSESENLQLSGLHVFYELHYVAVTNNQAVGRSARRGRHGVVEVFTLVGDRVDPRIIRVAEERQLNREITLEEVASELKLESETDERP